MYKIELLALFATSNELHVGVTAFALPKIKKVLNSTAMVFFYVVPILKGSPKGLEKAFRHLMDCGLN